MDRIERSIHNVISDRIEAYSVIELTEIHDKLELRLTEQKLRIDFYREKIAKVEEEIARYRVERKKEETSGKEGNESAA
jgi:uncharacterized small protein (DUF1192 family)